MEVPVRYSTKSRPTDFTQATFAAECAAECAAEFDETEGVKYVGCEGHRQACSINRAMQVGANRNH